MFEVSVRFFSPDHRFTKAFHNPNFSLEAAKKSAARELNYPEPNSGIVWEEILPGKEWLGKLEIPGIFAEAKIVKHD